MLSKTYIDFRNCLIEDLKEQFTISNLKLEKNPNLDGNKKENVHFTKLLSIIVYKMSILYTKIYKYLDKYKKLFLL